MKGFLLLESEGNPYKARKAENIPNRQKPLLGHINYPDKFV